MDMHTFARDLHLEAAKLPRDLLETLQKLAGAFGPTLEGTLPGMIENMKPHIQTLMLEAAMGTLDKEELEKVITGVLNNILQNKAA